MTNSLCKKMQRQRRTLSSLLTIREPCCSGHFDTEGKKSSFHLHLANFFFPPHFFLFFFHPQHAAVVRQIQMEREDGVEWLQQ